MKTVFDCETEIGRCDPQSLPDFQSSAISGGDCTVVGHTTACSTGSKGMLRIEHRCFLRQGEQQPEEPCMAPEVLMEPFVGSAEEIFAFVKQMHDAFVARARRQYSLEPVTIS